MKINQLSYYDHKRQWRLEPIEFSDFNLLVGVSGVGKTKIIQSILNLKKIANGDSLNGIEWDLSFTVNKNNYRWAGEFENKKLEKSFLKDDNTKISSTDRSIIIREVLYKDDQLIIERDSNNFVFQDKTLPKLSPFESVIKILRAEEIITVVENNLNKVIFNEFINEGSLNIDEYSVQSMLNTGIFGNNEDYILKIIKNFNMYPKFQLTLAYYNKHPIFQEIKEIFITIFDQVEDIKIGESEETLVYKDSLMIKIKEKGVDNWIEQPNISSGMLKTLMQISELYLSDDDTVILIDEFENSLGVNCINILSDLLSENRNLQFIITSHHPYIINKVGMEHWKIVTRKGGVVTAKDAKDFGLGKSRHEAFMQLINLDEYNEGISA
ncbi:MAG: AAA family ATPase [Cuspidothrix sp.]